MKTWACFVFSFLGAAMLSAAGWRMALPGWQYEFPRDHHAHPDFKTEWWYFTGNLADQSGRRFGYELTFFRQGIRSPNERNGTSSRAASLIVRMCAAGSLMARSKIVRGAGTYK